MKKILCLLILVLLASGCGNTAETGEPAPEPSAAPADFRPETGSDSGPEEFAAPDAEAEFPVFSSVDLLTEAIRRSAESGPSGNGPSAEARVRLGTVSRFPMLSEGSFPSYSLFRIEVLPDFIIFYYMPEDSPPARFDAETGITVTVARKSAYTLESLAAQTGIEPDPDGFLLDESRNDLAFTAGSSSSLITVHVPPGSFDLETLRSTLTAEEVEIPEAAEKRAHWGEYELRIPEEAEEISRTGSFDEEEGSVLDEVVFRYGEDVYAYRTQFTGRIKNISGFPDELVRGEHDDLLPADTPRCYTDRAEGTGVLLWLRTEDGRMFSLSMAEGADGEKLTALYKILTENGQQ